ncbi:hypothetical protein, partial [Acidithiobacillus caldus]
HVRRNRRPTRHCARHFMVSGYIMMLYLFEIYSRIKSPC